MPFEEPQDIYQEVSDLVCGRMQIDVLGGGPNAELARQLLAIMGRDLGRIINSPFSDPEALLYLTGHLARLDQIDAVLELFERVVRGGYFCYPAMASDPWLNSVRKKPAFAKLLKKVEQQHQIVADKFVRLEGDRILGLRTLARGAR